MKTFCLALALACGLFVAGAASAQTPAANVAGAWNLSVTTQRGTFDQTLKIQQDGSTIKGTISSRRGETPFTGAVKGNELTFSITRDTPNGTFTMNYDATVDGDSMKGTAKNDRFSMDFTGKRAAANTQ
ncbi:MAG: hypothetical protein ACRD3D_09565 [Terriglobia bacterium]